jgi:general secretion pathway protein K
MMLPFNIGSSRGVALVIVLWIMVILSVIALEFSYSMRIETELTKNFSDGQRAYFGARAGVERAVKEILRSQKALKLLGDIKEEPLWNLRGEPNHFMIGDTEIEVAIEPENARINLNDIPNELLREIIAGMGLTEEKIGTVIDSLLDWQDGDNLHRMMGAEKDYYQKLDTPYHPVNGIFEALEELLMVRGIDKRIFYGDEALPTVADFISEEEPELHVRGGLASILTVYSGKHVRDDEKGASKDKERTKVDVNSAPEAVLMSLPLMDEVAAQAILDARREEPIRTVADLVHLIGLPLYKGIEQYITLGEEDLRYYTITSTAFSGQQRVSRCIRAVVDIVPEKEVKELPYDIIRWEDWKV